MRYPQGKRARVNMNESFSEMFENSLANQRIRPGMILTGLVVDVSPDVVIINVGLKSEAVIPLEQFKNERGEVEVKAGDSSKWPSTRSKTVPARRGCRATRPSARAPGRAWKRPWRWRDRDRRHLRQGQGRLHGRDRERARLPAGFAGRHASGARHRAISRARRWSSRSSSSTGSATTSWSRAAPWSSASLGRAHALMET